MSNFDEILTWVIKNMNANISGRKREQLSVTAIAITSFPRFKQQFLIIPNPEDIQNTPKCRDTTRQIIINKEEIAYFGHTLTGENDQYH